MLRRHRRRRDVITFQDGRRRRRREVITFHDGRRRRCRRRDVTANWNFICRLRAPAQNATCGEGFSDRRETVPVCSVDPRFESILTTRSLVLVFHEVILLLSSPRCKDGHRCRFLFRDVISRWLPTSGFWSRDFELPAVTSLPTGASSLGFQLLLKNDLRRNVLPLTWSCSGLLG